MPMKPLTDAEIAEVRAAFDEPLEPESWHDGKVLRLLDEVERSRKAIDEVTASIKATRLENPLVAGISEWLGSLAAILTRPS